MQSEQTDGLSHSFAAFGNHNQLLGGSAQTDTMTFLPFHESCSCSLFKVLFLTFSALDTLASEWTDYHIRGFGVTQQSIQNFMSSNVLRVFSSQPACLPELLSSHLEF